MRAAAAAALALLAHAARAKSGNTILVPAVGDVPVGSLLSPDDHPPADSIPPMWEGPPGTMGFIPESQDEPLAKLEKGAYPVWESAVANGTNLIFGVHSKSGFKDPALGLEALGIEIKSSLEPAIFPTSLAAAMANTARRTPVVDIEAVTAGCPLPPNQFCRIRLKLGPVAGFKLPLGNERLQIIFSQKSFVKKKNVPSPLTFYVTINDDAGKDDLQEILADAIEVAVGVTMLTGSSSPAALLSSRLMLMMHIKCGEHHDALDHATNPMELAVGLGPNRFYLGGLLSNLLLGFVPLFLHLLLTLGHLCSARQAAAAQGTLPADSARASAPNANPLLGGVFDASMDSDECRCCGTSLSELRQQQATVRYPHYTLLGLLFAFQGIATCGFRLLSAGHTQLETAGGLMALVFICGGLLLIMWWKLGRGDARRIEAEFVLCRERRRTRQWDYFLGPGEWVSNSRARLVHTYGILFEAYREERQRFILVEMGLLLPLAVLGTLDASTWEHCIIEAVAAAALLAVFLGLVWWWQPWASRWDNHVLLALTGLMVVDMVFLAASFSGHDVGNTVHQVFEQLMLVLMGLTLIKCCSDAVLLCVDTVKQRRWRLQEAFEQGQTLYRGRDLFRRETGTTEWDDDETIEREEKLLAILAPSAVSAFIHHVYPTDPAPPSGQPPGDAADRDPAAPAPPPAADLDEDFDHAADCPVAGRQVRLTAEGFAQTTCPGCSANRPPPRQAGPGEWLRFFTPDGDEYWWNSATRETTWHPPGQLGGQTGVPRDPVSTWGGSEGGLDPWVLAGDAAGGRRQAHPLQPPQQHPALPAGRERPEKDGQRSAGLDVHGVGTIVEDVAATAGLLLAPFSLFR
eukprot:TRINITY_DN55253_c0_g1_i1.p1 TRINITY_DN55253_c0_g1~~TRINITY_DN55253_c0_g1_i1.p1  ORF type:complete len:879 (+),score=194.17 TRINITY_DN55253_c0_g1_i1:66-2639(+)